MFDDILGFTLKEGLEVVEKEGFKYKINKYLSPRRRLEEFDLNRGRIVRVKLLDEKFIEITVCNFSTPF